MLIELSGDEVGWVGAGGGGAGAADPALLRSSQVLAPLTSLKPYIL